MHEKRWNSLSDFDCFRKCIAILTNDDFFTTALIDRTIIRGLTNDYAHVKHHVVTQQILDSAGYAEEMYTKADRPLPQNINIQNVMRDLSQTLQRSEDYYKKKEEIVEKSIDDCINAHIPDEGDVASAPADYRILLSYLDSL